MPDSAQPKIDRIIGTGILTVEALASELRKRLIRRLTKLRFLRSHSQLLAIAREELEQFEPLLAITLRDVELAAWITGAHRVFQKVPPSLWDRLTLFPPPPNDPPRGLILGGWGGEEEPIIRFPLIDRAAETLAKRNAVTRETFDGLAADAKARAFTIAEQSSVETLERIRDALAADVAEGTSLNSFRKRLKEDLLGGDIGPAHLETVYRTNVQAAFSEGHDYLADNPVVAELFPYQEYLAIHDARVRHNHLELESLGIDGTNIYRRDDPFWDYFTPPLFYNCRCGINLLTIDAAASRGVREAKSWLKTGMKPDLNSRLPAIPFRPEPGWSRRSAVAA